MSIVLPRSGERGEFLFANYVRKGTWFFTTEFDWVIPTHKRLLREYDLTALVRGMRNSWRGDVDLGTLYLDLSGHKPTLHILHGTFDYGGQPDFIPTVVTRARTWLEARRQLPGVRVRLGYWAESA